MPITCITTPQSMLNRWELDISTDTDDYADDDVPSADECTEEIEQEEEEETMEPDDVSLDTLFPADGHTRSGDCEALPERRWIARQQLSDDELPYNQHIRIASAVVDALASHSCPVVFVLHHSGGGGSDMHCAWWPPRNEKLAVDVLRTLWVTLACQRFWELDTQPASSTISLAPLRHRALVKALLHAVALGPVGPLEYDGSRAEADELLSAFFGAVATADGLGELRHLYFYEHDNHWDQSVYAPSLDIKLATFHWQC